MSGLKRQRHIPEVRISGRSCWLAIDPERPVTAEPLKPSSDDVRNLAVCASYSACNEFVLVAVIPSMPDRPRLAVVAQFER